MTIGELKKNIDHLDVLKNEEKNIQREPDGDERTRRLKEIQERIAEIEETEIAALKPVY